MNSFVSFLYSLIHSMIQLLSFGKKTLTNSLSIYIKTNTGSTLSVDLDPKWDIKSVKEIVAPRLGLQPDEVKIIFAGKQLCDSTTIEECDLGQQSVLHAIKVRPQARRSLSTQSPLMEEESAEEPSKPMCETMSDLSESDGEKSKAHFYVHCSQCQKLAIGKLRVRCSVCKSGAFTVFRDPDCWDDVLKARRIHGNCEGNEIACVDNEDGAPPFAEFYFKCGEHPSGGETDFAAPLNLIKRNVNNVPCLACTDTRYNRQLSSRRGDRF